MRIQADFLLRNYSAIIIDEAHERSVNTDILVGLLSRIVPLRAEMAAAGEQGLYPLRLIVMSATLRVEDFVSNPRLFPTPPPLIRVDARQYPVTIHFNRRTPELDYVSEAYKKVCKIHKKLPPGGVLVFLTGRKEVDDLCRKLRREFDPLRLLKKREKAQARKKRAAEAAAAAAAAVEGDGPRARASSSAASASAAQQARDQGPANPWAGLDEDTDDEEDGASVEAEAAEEEEAEQEEEAEEALEGALEAARRARVGFGNEEEDAEEDEGEAGGEEEEEEEEEEGEEAGGEEDSDAESDSDAEVGPVDVSPLYSMLSTREQLRALRPPREGYRKIVVATNVAETSLTIPGIKYVVDSGKAKERVYDGYGGCGLSSFVVDWISKASADQCLASDPREMSRQDGPAAETNGGLALWTRSCLASPRAGRAGRVGPGHCYRLYSSAVFTGEFPKFSEPEILRTPIEGVVLQMKFMGIQRVTSFPYPTPPERPATRAAVRLLTDLGALQPLPRGPGAAERDVGDAEEITALGRAMAAFPVSPRFAKMLLLGWRGGCMPYAIALVALLSVQDLFRREAVAAEDEAEGGGEGGEGDGAAAAAAAKEKAKRERAAMYRWLHAESDLLGALRALGAMEHAAEGMDEAGVEAWCLENGLLPKSVKEAQDLRAQLTRIVGSLYPSRAAGLGARMPGPPTADQEALLRQLLAAGLVDQVARRVPSTDPRAASLPGRRVAYEPCALMPGEAAGGESEPAFIHPSSFVCGAPPDFLVYREIIRTSRPYMRGVTAISPDWLPRLAGPTLVQLGPPLDAPPPRYDAESDGAVCWRQPTYGPRGWELPPVRGPHPDPQRRCALFGRALLEGKAYPAFASFTPQLDTKPSVLAASDTRLLAHGKASALVAALASRGVESRKTAEAAWAADPRFLLEEVASWLPAAERRALAAAWPPLGGGKAKHKKKPQR
eukprot:tig00000113_g5693.t1